MARRPSLSYANVMSSIAVFLALGGGAWAVTGQAAPAEIHACVKKAGKKKGQLRDVVIARPGPGVKLPAGAIRWYAFTP